MNKNVPEEIPSYLMKNWIFLVQIEKFCSIKSHFVGKFVNEIIKYFFCKNAHFLDKEDQRKDFGLL